DDDDEDDDDDHDGCCYADSRTGRYPNEPEDDSSFEIDLDSIRTFVTDQVNTVVNTVSKLGGEIGKKFSESRGERSGDEEDQETRRIRINLLSSSIYIKFEDVRDFEIHVSNPSTDEPMKLPERFEVVRNGESIRISEKGREFMGIPFGLGDHESVHIDLVCPNQEPYRLLRVNTMSGSIEARSVKAQQIQLSTLSGSISLEDSHPETLFLNSVSGEIELDNAGAPQTKISSVSGSVKCFARDVKISNLNAKSVSGSLQIEVGSLLNNSKLSAVSGSIRFVSPRMSDQNFRVSTVSGHIQTPLGESVKDKRNKQYLDGVTDTSLAISTVSGRIRLEDNGA
ncbi:MAG: DUF4097 family beta strand repeat-containing protein, partial [Bacillota bacterium]|nr:DUF4097 family beta strand repeat-containing protein [Bacillota bacterium]